MAKTTTSGSPQITALKHATAKRKNIPTAEQQPFVSKEQSAPKTLRYKRNPDLDPQLVWRGKDEQDGVDLVVNAPPLYIQEKIHPQALIEDLRRHTQQNPSPTESGGDGAQIELFADFNGVAAGVDKTEFYQHEQNWSNRLILGDSLQVMASLAEREGLRGQVQCIYLDPPYGIKFNSNFQWSTTSRDVKDGKAEHITREPEQVKAFRDTWRDGIHSYLSYLRDRFMLARDLLSDSGSIFVQIGDENVHRVRAVLDEVFGSDNFICQIIVQKTGGLVQDYLPRTHDILLWFAKNRSIGKYRQIYLPRSSDPKDYSYIDIGNGEKRSLSKKEREARENIPVGARMFSTTSLESANPKASIKYNGKVFTQRWKTNVSGLMRLGYAGRFSDEGKTLRYVRFYDDFPVRELQDVWADTMGERDIVYVVQTNTKIIERCILSVTDPGDLVLDPTCGSGTTAYVAEQWGRRWISIDTSRVALALARARIMGARYARYPYYLLADSAEGQAKEAEVTGRAVSDQAKQGDIRHGFVYQRVPHITLKSIANNAEIDVIWTHWQTTLEPLREQLNAAVNSNWQEWEVPREAYQAWGDAAKNLHAQWWQARIARQQAIDASIAAKAEFETLYDQPYENKKIVRVAGPFTVESASPHRMLGVDDNDELIDPLAKPDTGYDFAQTILEHLKSAGVQQAHKADRIQFSALNAWPGQFICADGRYLEGDSEKRAAIFVGGEFSTVRRADLVEAAREASEAGFDVLIACAFNFEAHSTEFNKLGHIPVLKARMNTDLHMAEDLKNTGKGNLFVVFGEPDIELKPTTDGGAWQVTIKGVDVFKPQTGEVVSDNTDNIACWFIDTDYNQESFFVRHAYFLGAADPYKALKNTLKADINLEAWDSLSSDTSRPFPAPPSGRIAVKVINHLGDEVMKVFRVG